MFLAVCLVFYIMITRVIATAGVATARSPMIAAFVLVSGLGGSTISGSGLVAMSFTYVWQAEMRLFPMIACANGLKLAETVRGPKRRLLWAIVLALGASLVGAGWVFMQSTYTHGGLNLNPFFARFGHRPLNDLLPVIRDMKGPDLRGWGFTAIGAAVESFLIYAQHHLHWWRIHPVGFIIGSGWLTGQMWFSVFLARLSKLIIMK